MAARKADTREQNGELIKKLVEGIDIAMLTTVAKGGHLVSRPLSTQGTSFDGQRVWFFTEGDTPKADEIRRHSAVNLAYASKEKNTYVSLSGDATIHRDRRRINQFWNPAMKVFFPKGRTDPNLVLIEVAVRTAEYWDGPGSFLGKAVTFVLAALTGNDDAMAENRIIDMSTGRSRTPPSNDTAPRKTAAGKRRAAAGLTKQPTARKPVPRKPAPARKPAGTQRSATKSVPAKKRGLTKSTRKTPSAA